MTLRATPDRRVSPPDLAPEDSPNLIYFSSVSGNTRRFVERLGMPAARIPLRPRLEGMLHVNRPFVLIVPTYGGGSRSRALPRQVAQFLNVPRNRSLLRGVITAGNTNFGQDYCLAGTVVAEKCGIPELYRFELLGTPHDVARVREGLTLFWSTQPTDPED